MRAVSQSVAFNRLTQAPGATQKSRRHKISSWWFEFSAILLSFVSFGSLVYLLITYNGEPISKWTKFPLSLNAIISILASISKASMAFVVSQCLAQCKWNWVGTFIEPLIDFDRFDAASRGAWGCLRLLQSMFRRAVAIPILLAYEPFIQVILTFEDRSVALNTTQHAHISATDTSQTTRSAAIGSCSRLDAGSWIVSTDVAVGAVRFNTSDGKRSAYNVILGAGLREDMGMTASVWNGFSYLVAQENLWPAFSCASGNCTWDPFPSIAVCSRCHDISGHVKKKSGITRIPNAQTSAGWVLVNGTQPPDVSNSDSFANRGLVGAMNYTKYEIRYPLDLSISNYDGPRRCGPGNLLCPDTYLSTRVTSNPGLSLNFQDYTTMIVAIQYMEANASWKDNKTWWEDTTVTATECGLYFCVNEYETKIDKGVLNETVVSSWSNKTSDSYSSFELDLREYMEIANSTLDMNQWGYVNLTDLQISIPEKNTTSRPDNSTQRHFNITQASIDSLYSIFRDGFEDTTCKNCSLEERSLIYPAFGNRAPADFMFGLGESGDSAATLRNAAVSLTKWMRDRQLASSPIMGTAKVDIIVTRVEWKYLAFPAACLLIGLIFVVLSIWETSRLRQPPWKDSSLAILAHSPSGDLKTELQAAAEVSDLEDVARKSQVALEYREGHGQLALRQDEKQNLDETWI
ncbi:hypothetical protein BGZ63DRAFT_270509 [Mariannaea sp. PMI_226]|nr:hypothetical protein BGZ63DRAFT_270509 [Mariannaea sp. PMI_226]